MSDASDKTVPDVKILLANRTGAFALFSAEPKSRHEGFFVRRNDKMMKVAESIRLNLPVTGVLNELWRMARSRGKVTEYFFLPLHEEGLVYELSEVQEIELCLDIKIMEDNRVWGRKYDVEADGGALVIRFRKEHDDRDNNNIHREEFEGFAAIAGDNVEFLPLHHWEEHQYQWDAERSSPPDSRWVFKPAKIRSNGFAIAFDESKNSAVSKAKDIWSSKEELKKEREAYVGKLVAAVPKHASEQEKLAFQCAKNALDSLMLDEHCVIAGLPWFYQCWTRDELVCVKALNRIGHLDVCRKMFSRLLESISTGMLPNMEGTSQLAAADAVGWLFFRIDEWLAPLMQAGIFDEYVSKREKETIANTLQKTIDTLWRSRVKNDLLITQPKESWMDTEWGADSRQGALIEMQALLLAMFRTLRHLSGQRDSRESLVRKAVMKHFWTGTFLSDVADQKVIRPNIFIAAYVCPELLSRQQWSGCFESVLPKLWLSWGGLSSIDKKSELFTDTYTGENNQSYHRGDSWFWVNNLAAIVLHRIDDKRFKKYVDKIIEASVSEILYKGATGHHAELSSAKQLEGNGCLSQAWSAAMFIELVEEVYGKVR
ncbi:MAG: hypothetical protein HY363_02065 [Candidatus Aenigmarchaeota archaeon]|nr:hypothetical protein [Candidatus Aenigmarchaeota archaeon]